jgi:hypothetical protein
MKRFVLAMAAIAACPPTGAQSIPLGEIVEGDHALRDSLYGVTARFPNGWTVRGVTRWGDKETTIYLGVPRLPDSFPTLYYRIFSPPTLAIGDAETFLRNEARTRAERRVANGLADYANDPDSFVFKTIGGHAAMCHVARYSAGGRTICEYFVRVLSEKGVAQFLLRAHADDFAALRGEFDDMAESVRLP